MIRQPGEGSVPGTRSTIASSYSADPKLNVENLVGSEESVENPNCQGLLSELARRNGPARNSREGQAESSDHFSREAAGATQSLDNGLKHEESYGGQAQLPKKAQEPSAYQFRYSESARKRLDRRNRDHPPPFGRTPRARPDQHPAPCRVNVKPISRQNRHTR